MRVIGKDSLGEDEMVVSVMGNIGFAEIKFLIPGGEVLIVIKVRVVRFDAKEVA